MSELWNDRRLLTLPADAEGRRLDVLLHSCFPDWSRSRLRELFACKAVYLDQRVAKPGDKYKRNQRLSVQGDIDMMLGCPADKAAAPAAPAAQAMPLDIRYEDAYLLVLNKAQGLVVHPAAGHWDDTLVNGLVARYGDGLSSLGGPSRPGIVHRLDKDTSGLLLVVKDGRAHSRLAEALRRHAVDRRYLAIVHGSLPDEGLIDAPIARSLQDRKRMAVREGGRQARTEFRCLQRFGAYSLADLKLQTGRTHQIRVHMQYIRHPILGDPLYSGDNAGRDAAARIAPEDFCGQFLHAYRLRFRHPMTDALVDVKAPLPANFRRSLLALGADPAGLRAEGLWEELE